MLHILFDLLFLASERGVGLLQGDVLVLSVKEWGFPGCGIAPRIDKFPG
jgi:hypothetical protein